MEIESKTKTEVNSYLTFKIGDEEFGANQVAAASEEMTTSSYELASQAEQLKEIIGSFKIEENNETGISNETVLQ